MEPRRTQHERSQTTQHQLLEAALDCINERGYNGATTAAVSERAGVSRGAQLHHYPTRMALITAATEHLFACFADDVERMARDFANPANGIGGFVDGLWDEMFNGRFFFVSLELIVTARNDQTLHKNLVPLIKALHTRLDMIWRGLFTEKSPAPAGVDTLLNITLCLMRGMAVQSVLREDAEYYRELLDTWKNMLGGLLHTPSSPAGVSGRRGDEGE